MLQSDGAACGGDSRGDQRGHVAGSQSRTREGPARAQGRHRSRRPGSRCRGSGQADQPGQRGQRPGGDQRGHPLLDHTHLPSVAPAPRAVLEVAPHVRARAHPLVVSQRELLADVRAGGVTRRVGLDQSHPGPNQERFDRRHGRTQNNGQLGVREAGQLAQQEGRALLFWESPDVLDQTAQRLSGIGANRRIIGGAG